jgi:uncharacterized coiled-coil protein SlyX
MHLLIPNEQNPIAEITLPDTRRKSAFIRLARAVDEMSENLVHQQREVNAFRKNMQTLQVRMLETGKSLRLHHDALGEINIARLGRKARRLAQIIEVYEAGC